MKNRRHYEVMFGVMLLVLLLIAGPLAILAGADSRIDDVARRRRFNG